MLSALMMSKFNPIVRGTVYNPDSFQYDSFSISADLTKEDLRRMRKYLRRFGYKVYRRGEGADEGKEFVSATQSAFEPMRRGSMGKRLGTLVEKSVNVFFRLDSQIDDSKVSASSDVKISISDRTTD